MSDFFAPPPNYPQVPEEPDTPAPDVETFATNLGIGFNKSGSFGAFWAPFIDALLAGFVKAIGFVLRGIFAILGLIFQLFSQTTDEAALGYGVLVAAVLQDLFGVTVDPSTVNTRRAGPDRQAVANRLGQSLVGTFFSQVNANPGGGITPSDAAANQFLAVMMNMELNGWLEAWVADGLSVHLLEKWGELKDGISRTLGLGRMSRQVFAAPIKVLVHDPYLALLEQKYRPKPVNEQTAMRAFFRGDISRGQLSTTLGNQGYSEQYIDWLVTDHQKFLPDADVDYLLSRGIWTDDDATQYLQTQGYDLASAQRVVQVMDDKRIHKYRLEMVTAAEPAFVKGDIAIDQWQNIVETAGLTDEEVTWILKVAGMKREMHITHLSLGQIETGIKDGILNLTDLETWAQRNGMPADEEKYLELMILFAMNKESVSAQAKAAAASAKATAAAAKQQAAATKAAAAKAQAADKGVTIAQAESLVKDGLWTFDQLTAFLTAKGYGADAIASIVALLHAAIAKTSTSSSTATAIRTAASAKGLPLANAEQAVVEGILTMADLQKTLTSHGFDAADSQVILDLTQEKLDQANVKAAAKAATAAAKGKKSISLSNLERAVRLGITTIDTYNTELTAAGFDAASIALLDGILNDQIASDAAKAAAKGVTTGKTAGKAPSASQIEQEVLAGIRPIADYTAALATLGYSAADAAQLTQLAQHKLDHAAAALALHSDAQGKATEKGISLSAAENGVLNGINKMADYDAMLTRLGYDQADRDTLEALLLAKVQAKAAKAGAAAPTTPAAG